MWGWIKLLFSSVGDIRALLERLLGVAKNVSANARRKDKDAGVDDAIAAALGEQLHDGDSEQQPKAD